MWRYNNNDCSICVVFWFRVATRLILRIIIERTSALSSSVHLQGFTNYNVIQKCHSSCCGMIEDKVLSLLLLLLWSLIRNVIHNSSEFQMGELVAYSIFIFKDILYEAQKMSNYCWFARKIISFIVVVVLEVIKRFLY